MVFWSNEILKWQVAWFIFLKVFNDNNNKRCFYFDILFYEIYNHWVKSVEISQKQFKMENSVKKPFQCEIYDSHFTREANLERHSLSVHERKMPFTCEICDYNCSQKSHIFLRGPYFFQNFRRECSANKVSNCSLLLTVYRLDSKTLDLLLHC